MPHTLDREIDNFKAVGHGVISIFTTAILLAIVAVVLANGATTASVITAFFKLLSWLVSIIVNPVSGGSQTNIDTPTLVPAAGVQTVANSGGGSIAPTTSAPATGTPSSGAGTGGGTGTTTYWNVYGPDGQWKGITTDPTLINPGETVVPGN